MTYESLRDRLRKRPFLPFRVVMDDESAYPVVSPRMAMALAGGLVVGIGDGSADPNGFPEDVHLCPLEQIHRIELLETVAA